MLKWLFLFHYVLRLFYCFVNFIFSLYGLQKEDYKSRKERKMCAEVKTPSQPSYFSSLAGSLYNGPVGFLSSSQLAIVGGRGVRWEGVKKQLAS